MKKNNLKKAATESLETTEAQQARRTSKALSELNRDPGDIKRDRSITEAKRGATFG